MKIILLSTLLSSQVALAWNEIHCNRDSITVVFTKRSRYYSDVSIKLTDPEIIALAGAREVAGHAYGSYRDPDMLDHAFFRLNSTVTDGSELQKIIYLRLGARSGANLVQGTLSVFREGKTECLRYEEYCSCCYYGDCSPKCLDERSIPAVTFLEKTMTCEVF